MANTFRVDEYRPTKVLTIAVTCVFALQILCFVLYICFAFGHMLKPDFSIDGAEGKSVSVWLLLVGLVGALEILLTLATIVVFLIWEHRSFSNLSPLQAKNLEFSPGWAVGWWFIPFANLVKPYQAMKELWRESDPDYDEDIGFLSSNYGVPVFFGFWWACWLISNVISRIADKAFYADLTNGVAFLLILSSVLSIAAAGLLIIIVRDIYDRQEKRYKRIGARVNDVPPPPPTFGAQE